MGIKYILVGVLIMIVVMLLLWKLPGRERLTGIQIFSRALLTAYLFLVYSSTIISRIPREEYRYQLEVFWSYKRAVTLHDQVTLWEDILNIFLLMPMGLLLPLTGKRGDRSKRLFWVALSGFLVSVSIEVVQLMTKRGLFEFDDMINNTFGVMVGYGIYMVLRRLKRNG